MHGKAGLGCKGTGKWSLDFKNQTRCPGYVSWKEPTLLSSLDFRAGLQECEMRQHSGVVLSQQLSDELEEFKASRGTAQVGRQLGIRCGCLTTRLFT